MEVTTFCIYKAIESQNLERLAKIFPRNNINQMVFNGYMPLHWAVHFEHVSVVKLLLELGACPNGRTNNGRTALHMAAGEVENLDKSFKLIWTLVFAKADVNVQDALGKTPLYLATEVNNLRSVQLLLHQNADPNIPSFYNETPFMISLKSLDCEPISNVLVNYVSNFDNTLQHTLSMDRPHPLALFIVEKSSEISLTNAQRYALLKQSLIEKRAIAFEKLFPRFHYSPKNTRDFFKTFLMYWTSPTFDKCFLLILDSKYGRKLMKELNSFEKTFEVSVCSAVLQELVSHPDETIAIKMLEKLLRLGMKIYLTDFILVHKFYGFNKEFRLLAKYPISLHRIPLADNTIYGYSSLVMPCFMIYPGSFNSPTLKTILRNCLANLTNTTWQDEQIRYLASYFTLRPYYRNSDAGKISTLAILRLQNMPKVPSLLELTRNKVQYIVASNSTSMTTLYDNLDTLNIPLKCRQILMFERGIYSKFPLVRTRF